MSSLLLLSGAATFKAQYVRTLLTPRRCLRSRNGQAVRLSHDHKASDAKEAERIDQAGGFIMNQRVNGESFITG